MDWTWLWEALRTPEAWMPRAMCVLNDTGVIVRAHLADAMQAIGYTALSAYFIRYSNNLLVTTLFVSFLVLCAVTHVFDSLMYYVPAYHVGTWIGVASGVSALVTAFLVWWKKIEVYAGQKNDEGMGAQIFGSVAEVPEVVLKDLRTKRRLQEIGREAPTSIWFVSVDDEHRIEWVNDECRENYLLSADQGASDPLGKTPHEVYEPEVADKIVAGNNLSAVSPVPVKRVENNGGVHFYVVRSRHNVLGDRIIRKQAEPLRDILGAVAASLPVDEAVDLLRAAYHG